MSAQQPRLSRPWSGIGIGWLFAVAVVFIIGGSLIPLWGMTDHLRDICLLLLALAMLL